MCVIYQRANKRLEVKLTVAKEMTRSLEKLDLGMAVQNALWTRFELIDLISLHRLTLSMDFPIRDSRIHQRILLQGLTPH